MIMVVNKIQFFRVQKRIIVEFFQEAEMFIGHHIHVICHRWTFLWVCVKPQVYKTNPQSTAKLKNAIICVHFIISTSIVNENISKTNTNSVFYYCQKFKKNSNTHILKMCIVKDKKFKNLNNQPKTKLKLTNGGE